MRYCLQSFYPMLSVHKNRIFYLYLCTFPFNHIPITPSIDVEHFYSFRNATRSLRILVQPLSHILRNSLGFFLNCEYELIFCLLLSIMGKQFYNILGNCKDCLTDVQKQTHIQYKEESLKAEDLVRSLASLWCYSKITGSQVFVVFLLSLLRNLLTNFSLCSLSWFSKKKKNQFCESISETHPFLCV